MKMKATVKLGNADRAVGLLVNVAVCERIFDGAGHPLSDSIVGAVDAIITSVGSYWSDQPHGESGRYYDVLALGLLPTPRTLGATIILGV